MYKICVFAGTTEGRKVVEFLSKQPCLVTACVATEYGESLLSPKENLTISSKRLTEEEMVDMLGQEQFDLVIDATHPYAQVVTENIRSACQKATTSYLRVLREDSATENSAVYVPDIDAAVEYLNSTQGNILLTTGSKELGKYAGLVNFSDRVYARVLPMDSSLAACKKAGLKPARIIAMQGPFSEEMNEAMLIFTNAAYLVTKDGGETGGFPEKAEAARKMGTTLVVIGRPPQVDGLTLADTLSYLEEKFNFSLRPNVTIVGIGPGSKNAMTAEVLEAIANAKCLIGAKRMLKAVACPGQTVVDAIAPEKIAEAVEAYKGCGDIAVVMSGDSGFFSGTKKLLPLLKDAEVKVLPGLSSLSVLCARLGKSYEDVLTVSLHGRSHDIAADVRTHSKVFALVGGQDGVNNLCHQLIDANLGEVLVSVGQHLSYPDEKITIGLASALEEGEYHPLSAVLIENPNPVLPLTYSLPDNAFQRNGENAAIVPMTKEEIRTLSISKLHLTPDAICWDVGAGTGSVSIEMALRCPAGQVYAIERKEDAVSLLEENKAKFHASNLQIVHGFAPEACENLLAPTHVFIGGSAGNLRQILDAAREKNPACRIVVTAIALETVAELTACLKDFPGSEIVCVNVAKGKKAGLYHLMMGNNPVYILTIPGGAEE